MEKYRERDGVMEGGKENRREKEGEEETVQERETVLEEKTK